MEILYPYPRWEKINLAAMTFKLASPRLFYCRCQRRKTTSFRPLSALLTESAAPELLFMETKWASLVSYGLTVDALTDFLPLEVTLDVKTVRHDALKVAERCEAELGEEQWSFIDGCPRDWGALPIPDLTFRTPFLGSLRDFHGAPSRYTAPRSRASALALFSVPRPSIMS